MVGGGRMGEALLAGLIAAGLGGARRPGRRRAGRGPPRRAGRAPSGPVRSSDAPVPAAGAVLAVKPGHGARRRAPPSPAPASSRVLSIAAGVTLATIEAALPDGVAAVRAMPNTPALVGVGAAAVAPGRRPATTTWPGPRASSAPSAAWSACPRAQLDAVTGLSGSGPAYVFLVAEALIDAGVLVGLPRDVSTTLSVQTLLGSATLLAESDDGPRGAPGGGHLARRDDRGGPPRARTPRGAGRAARRGRWPRPIGPGPRRRLNRDLRRRPDQCIHTATTGNTRHP